MDLEKPDPENPLEAELPFELAATGSTIETDPANIVVSKVVIEYRSRGLPWPLVLPLLGLVALIVVAGERQLMRRTVAEPSRLSSTGLKEAAPRSAEVVQPAPTELISPHATEPLSASFQPVLEAAIKDEPIVITELVGPPVLKEQPQKLEEAPPAPVAKAAAPALPPLPNPPTDALQPTALATLVPNPPVPGPKPASVPTQAKLGVPPTESSPAAATVAPSEVPPADKPLPTRGEVLADIQREAEQKRAERRDLKQLKDEAPELERKEYLTRIRDERLAFLTELQQLITTKKKLEGGDIESLYARFIHELDPKLELELRQLMKRFSGRASLQSKIIAYRTLGVPEPMILDIACNEIHKRAHYSRCGCYDPHMYVLAARELIAAQRTSRRKAKTVQSSATQTAPLTSSASTKQASSGIRPAPRPQ